MNMIVSCTMRLCVHAGYDSKEHCRIKALAEILQCSFEPTANSRKKLQEKSTQTDENDSLKMRARPISAGQSAASNGRQWKFIFLVEHLRNKSSFFSTQNTRLYLKSEIWTLMDPVRLDLRNRFYLARNYQN